RHLNRLTHRRGRRELQRNPGQISKKRADLLRPKLQASIELLFRLFPEEQERGRLLDNSVCSFQAVSEADQDGEPRIFPTQDWERRLGLVQSSVRKPQQLGNPAQWCHKRSPNRI